MATIDELGASQFKLGNEILQVFENFKKESIDQRTIDKTKRFQGRLESLWTSFTAGHAEFERFKDTNSDHGYFQKDFFNQVNQVYLKFLKRIMERLSKAEEKQTLTLDWNLQSPPNEEHDDDNDSNNGEMKMFEPIENLEQRNRIRLQNSTMKSLAELSIAIKQTDGKQLTRAYIKTKINALVSYWNKISTLHKKIMSCESHYDYQRDYYTEIEELYHETMISLEERLDAFSGNQSLKVKLPQISLPTFDGNYMHWKQFQDLFTQLIVQQPIGFAQKLYYLKANLTGEPSRLISHLQATDENFSVV